MALTACKECGKEVSTGAGKCPHCGARVKKPAGIIGWIIGAAMLAYMVQCTSTKTDAENAKASAEASKTPGQKAAEAKQKEIKELRFQKTVRAASVLKSNLKDPASVQWESMTANEDGSVICLAYRAKNGFGALDMGAVVFVDGVAMKGTKPWNKHCSKGDLYEMKSARYALK